MTRKFVFGVAGVALAALVMAPSASASCNPNKNAQNFGGVGTAYWTVATPGVLSGTTWVVGNPTGWTHNGGVVPCDASLGTPNPWLYFVGNNIYVNLQLGTCGGGCALTGTTFAVSVQNATATGTETFTVSATENTTSAVFFDFAQTAPTHTLTQQGRPKVLNSARTTTPSPGLNMQFHFDSVAGSIVGPGLSGSVTGFRVLGHQGPTDPGPNASAYELNLATIPSTGGAATDSTTVFVPCSGLQDMWVASQVIYEGGAVGSAGVSQRTRAACDSNLADPRYKITPTKPKQAGNSKKR